VSTYVQTPPSFFDRKPVVSFGLSRHHTSIRGCPITLDCIISSALVFSIENSCDIDGNVGVSDHELPVRIAAG